MAGPVSSGFILLVIGTRFVISALSVHVPPCREDAPRGKGGKTSCLFRVPDQNCRVAYTRREPKDMDWSGASVSTVKVEPKESATSSSSKTFHLQWNLSSPVQGRRRRKLGHLVIVEVVSKGNIQKSSSCFYFTQPNLRHGRRKSGDRGTLSRKNRKKKRRRGKSLTAVLEVDIDVAIDGTEKVEEVRVLVLAGRRVKRLNKFSRNAGVLKRFHSKVASGNYHMNTIPIVHQATSTKTLQLNESTLIQLPPRKCESLYTDRTFTSMRWTGHTVSAVNVTPEVNVSGDLSHDFSLQWTMDVPEGRKEGRQGNRLKGRGKGTGYLIIVETILQGSVRDEASSCFYFSLPHRHQASGGQDQAVVDVEMAIRVQGEFNETVVRVLKGSAMPSDPLTFFKKKGEFDILKKFNSPVARGSYHVPLPPTPAKGHPQPGQTCDSWWPTTRSKKWHVLGKELLLEVSACPPNQLAFHTSLILVPSAYTSRIVNETSLTKEKCRGNLSVPTDAAYGGTWNVVLSWECIDCPGSARLSNRLCPTIYKNIFSDLRAPPPEDVTMMPWGRGREELAGVLAGVLGATSGVLVLVLALLLVRRRRRGRGKGRVHLSSTSPRPGLEVARPPNSTYVIYWPDHDLHREATRHLVAMMRSLGLDVALDVDSAEEIRRDQKPLWAQEKLKADTVVVVVSRGLLTACNLFRRGSDVANDTSDIYADIAPYALHLLVDNKFHQGSSRSQRVLLVSFGYDEHHVDDMRRLFAGVLNVPVFVLASRPDPHACLPQGSGVAGTSSPAVTNWSLVGFFFHLTGRTKWESVKEAAQSDSARRFERAAECVQSMRREER